MVRICLQSYALMTAGRFKLDHDLKRVRIYYEVYDNFEPAKIIHYDVMKI